MRVLIAGHIFSNDLVLCVGRNGNFPFRELGAERFHIGTIYPN
jgi:hypothetical protein